jgi:hypothetical protein
MKTVLILALLGCGAATVLAQGTVTFANVGAGVNAPIIDPYGNRLTSAGGWDIGLYAAGADGNWSMVALDQYATFVVPGYFNGGVQSVPGIPGGAQATFEIVAWTGAAGNDPFTAIKSPAFGWGLVQVGATSPFTVTLGGFGAPPTPPASLIGMDSFFLVCGNCLNNYPPFFLQPLPEPSTLALAGISTAVMVAFARSRKSTKNRTYLKE